MIPTSSNTVDCLSSELVKSPFGAMPVEPKPEGQCSASSTIHFLPCSIDYDGTAPINSFFQTRSDADGNLTSHLRGRKLRGKLVKLNTSLLKDCPDVPNSLPTADDSTVTGLCVGDSGNQNWIVEGHFTSINIWEHDSSPDPSSINEYLSWFMIADQVLLVTIESKL